MLHLFSSVALLNPIPLLNISFIELQSQDRTGSNTSIKELIFQIIAKSQTAAHYGKMFNHM